MLAWSQGDLAKYAGVSVPAIANIELGKHQPNASTREKLIRAFEEGGLELIEGGVRRKQEIVKVFEGEGATRAMQEDIYAEMLKKPGEILFLGVVEVDKESDPDEYEFTKFHIQRLLETGATEKLLVKEGATNFVAPKEWYRYIPAKYFSPYTYVIYGDKIALSFKDPFRKVMLIKNHYFAESLAKVFMMIWSGAEKPA